MAWHTFSMVRDGVAEHGGYALHGLGSLEGSLVASRLLQNGTRGLPSSLETSPSLVRPAVVHVVNRRNAWRGACGFPLPALCEWLVVSPLRPADHRDAACRACRASRL